MAAEREVEVAILGAGMSGLCMAIQLQRAGVHDFVLIEKSAGIGGTWWDNRYPGAQVDVPAPAYSFSFAPNAEWTHRFADAAEIQRYQQRLAEQHGLAEHTLLGVAVAQARFDAEAGRWRLLLDNGERLIARFFACSTGVLNTARWPDIPGLAAFEGRLLHSARWPEGLELAGQRVGVIGTGSTAAQLVPAIAPQVKHLTVFQRTPNWILPRLDRHYGWLDRWLTRLPGYAPLVRRCWVQVMEWGRRGFDEGTLARRMMVAAAQAHRRRSLPDARLQEQLTPPYPLGCKRIIYSNDYYSALCREQTELVTSGIRAVTPRGVLTDDGREHELDVLVCATGYDTVHPLAGVHIEGLEGRLLADVWCEGAQAYLGISVAGFPNFFLMLGPNTATGHTSTLLYIEPQVQHAIACMQRVRREGRRWIGVRADVAEAHDRAQQQRLATSVWSQCRSWYRAESGRIVAIWPGYTAEYVKAVRRPVDAAYLLG